MAIVDRRAEYLNSLVCQGMHYNLNQALCSLVTPPRRPLGKRVTMSNMETSFHKTPPNQSTRAAESLSKSLPKTSRSSPSRLSPGLLNGKGGFYAGAKFGERPDPADLPKPPNHWVSQEQNCLEMTNSLKMLLKVQA